MGGYSSKGFVEVLAASQSPTGSRWFQGTADAVRQYLWLFEDAERSGVEDFLILSGAYQASCICSLSLLVTSTLHAMLPWPTCQHIYKPVTDNAGTQRRLCRWHTQAITQQSMVQIASSSNPNNNSNAAAFDLTHGVNL